MAFKKLGSPDVSHLGVLTDADVTSSPDIKTAEVAAAIGPVSTPEDKDEESSNQPSQ